MIVHQDVLKLDISMHLVAVVVQIGDAVQNLKGDLRNYDFRDKRLALKRVRPLTLQQHKNVAQASHVHQLKD